MNLKKEQDYWKEIIIIANFCGVLTGVPTVETYVYELIFFFFTTALWGKYFPISILQIKQLRQSKVKVT